jgi:hypothetical protein
VLFTINGTSTAIDWNTMMFNCYSQWQHDISETDLDNCFVNAMTNSDLNAQIDAVGPRLRALYQWLAETAAPNPVIEVLTYPQIFPATWDPNNANACAYAPGHPFDTVPVQTSQTQVDLIRGAIHHLDAVIISEVNSLSSESGGRVRYINVENTFSGHEVCTNDNYVNDIVDDGNGGGKPESFHPDNAGYGREAALIKDTLDAIS